MKSERFSRFHHFAYVGASCLYRLSNSYFRQSIQFNQLLIVSPSSTSFSCGSLSFRALASISKPRKVRHIVGPFSFSYATGRPSCSNVCSSVVRAHSSDPGGPNKRKSSKWWIINFTSCGYIIHAAASATAVNILAADHSPNGSAASINSFPFPTDHNLLDVQGLPCKPGHLGHKQASAHSYHSLNSILHLHI